MCARVLCARVGCVCASVRAWVVCAQVCARGLTVAKHIVVGRERVGQLHNVLEDMRSSLEVKDRRKGLLRSYKSCFIGASALRCDLMRSARNGADLGCHGRCAGGGTPCGIALPGRDAVTWLSENAVDGKTLSRRQALQLSRELLEMGAVQQVFENAHGFKDDTTLYRFGTLPAATATLKKAS